MEPLFIRQFDEFGMYDSASYSDVLNFIMCEIKENQEITEKELRNLTLETFRYEASESSLNNWFNSISKSLS